MSTHEGNVFALPQKHFANYVVFVCRFFSRYRIKTCVFLSIPAQPTENHKILCPRFEMHLSFSFSLRESMFSAPENTWKERFCCVVLGVVKAAPYLKGRCKQPGNSFPRSGEDSQRVWLSPFFPPTTQIKNSFPFLPQQRKTKLSFPFCRCKCMASHPLESEVSHVLSRIKTIFLIWTF